MEGRAGSGYRPRSDGAKPFQCSFTCRIPTCDHRKTNKQETKTTTKTTNPKHHHNGFHILRLHGMEDSCERSEDWASRVRARCMYHFPWHQCGFSAVLPLLSQILLLIPGWPRTHCPSVHLCWNYRCLRRYFPCSVPTDGAFCSYFSHHTGK